MKYYYAPGSAAAHDRAVAELERGAPPACPQWAILRPAQPYDLATPGTPAGILDVARAAELGGAWCHRATLAVAASVDGGRVVASLALRLTGDLPGRARRAWVVYARAEDGTTGAVTWKPNGAGLLDAGDPARPVRPIGINELKCILQGKEWASPPPRPGPPHMRCYICDKPTPFSTTTWRPYARHRCDPTHMEGRS